MVYPNYQSVEDPNIRNLYEDFWGVKLDPNNGLTVVEIMNEVNKKILKRYMFKVKIQLCLILIKIMLEKHCQN